MVAVGLHPQMDDVGDGALPDDSVVEAQILIDLPPIPEHADIQHHPVFRGEVPILQIPKAFDLTGLQLRNEAQAPHVDAQHRHLVEGRELGKMQDGAVPSEGDEKIGSLHLRQQRPELGAGEVLLLLAAEGGADHGLKAQLPEDALRPEGGRQLPIPARVGAKNNTLHSFPSPCWRSASWDFSTKAARSTSASWPSPLRR